MAPKGWIGRTGQRWKLVVGVILLVVGGMALIAMVVVTGSANEVIGGRDRSDLIAWVAFALAAGGAGSVLWLVTAIRCPQCGSRPVWTLISARGSSQWSTRLLSLEVCPTCGFDGEVNEDSARRS